MPFHLDLKFLYEVNHVTVSDCLDKVCRRFYIHPTDVCLFVHDSPPYMCGAAGRFIKDKGHTNCVHLACWLHLFEKVPEAVFDGNVLAEQLEFYELVQLLYARLPFWRTKCDRYQKAAFKKLKDVLEQLPDNLKQRQQKERPALVKSVVRPTDTRWASQFDAYKYWQGHIWAFQKFLSEMLQYL